LREERGQVRWGGGKGDDFRRIGKIERLMGGKYLQTAWGGRAGKQGKPGEQTTKSPSAGLLSTSIPSAERESKPIVEKKGEKLAGRGREI